MVREEDIMSETLIGDITKEESSESRREKIERLKKEIATQGYTDKYIKVIAEGIYAVISKKK